MGMKINRSPVYIGLAQAVSAFILTVLLFLLMPLIFSWLPYKFYSGEIIRQLIPVVSAIAFIIAVLLYGLILLVYPGYLFVTQRVREAVKTIIYTVIFLTVLFILLLIGLYVVPSDESRRLYPVGNNGIHGDPAF